MSIINYIWVLVGAICSSFAIACVRVVQEYYRHTYSGFNEWRPFYELPFVLFITVIIILFVQFITVVGGWKKLEIQKESLIFGAICGCVQISAAIQHCCYSLVSVIPKFEWVIIIIVFFIALNYRFRLNKN